MNRIKWVQCGEIDIGFSQIPHMVTKVGGFFMDTSPVIDTNKRKIISWRHCVFYEEEFISLTKHARSKESSQKNAEKLVLEYLRGYAFQALRELKKMGLLEEALSEIGIDI